MTHPAGFDYRAAARDEDNSFSTGQTITDTSGAALTLAYDGSNKADLTPSSTGDLTLALSGTNPSLVVQGGGAHILERTVTATNTLNSTILSRLTTTGDMADGFGPQFTFTIKDDAGVSNSIFSFGATRNGADNTGRGLLAIYIAGTFTRRMVMDSTGALIGSGILATSVSGAPMEGFLRNTGTNDVVTVTAATRESTGTPAANYGGRHEWKLESSTTIGQLAAAVDWVWSTATHATRTAYLKFSIIVSAVETEIMRLTANGVVTKGRQRATVTKSDNYTATGTDEIIAFTATGKTLSLPAATGSGQTYTVFAEPNITVMIDGNSTDTIDGELTQTLEGPGSIILHDYASGKWCIG